MRLPTLDSDTYRCRQSQLHHRFPSEAVLLLSSALVILSFTLWLHCCPTQPARAFADGPPVTQEIRYYVPDAGEVFLVWGINGWGVVPEVDRPAGTVMKNDVMHTPMSREGAAFVAQLKVTAGATMDYGFLITQKRDGTAVLVWEDNEGQGYRTTATENAVIEIRTTLVLARHQQATAGGLDAELPWVVLILLTGIGIASGVLAERTREMRSTRSPQGTLDVVRQVASSERFQRGLLWGIVFLGLLLRLRAAGAWNAVHPDSPERLWGDEIGYNSVALAILYRMPLDWPGRAPLYPLWLAMAHRLTRQSYSAIPYIQALLGTAVIPLSYSLGRRIFRQGAALIAAFLAATTFPLVHQSVHFLSEVLYTPLVLVVVIALWEAIRRPTIARFCWAGLWVGISAYVRPTLLFFPLFSIVILVIALGRRHAMRGWTAYALAASLIVMPWIVRGYVRFDTWLPMATNNGWLWLGSPESYHLTHDEGYSYTELLGVVYSDRPGRDPHTIAGNRYWTVRALRSIAREPLVYLRYCVEKVGFYWFGHPGADWGGTHAFNYALLRRWDYTPRDAALYLFGRAMPILALLASLILRREWRRLLPVYGMLVYCTLLHAAAHAEARLSDPLQPLLMVLVGGAATAIWETLSDRIRCQAPPPPSANRQQEILVAAVDAPTQDGEIQERNSVL